MLILDFYEMKKRAKNATKNRSMRPDAEYIVLSLLLCITIIGLPVAYCIMKEYHRYLETCRREFVENGEPQKGKIYSHTPATGVMFDYKLKNVPIVLKTVWTILSAGSIFVYYDNLSKNQLLMAKKGTEMLKMLFPAVPMAFLAAFIIFIAGITVNPLILLSLLLLVALMIRPIAVYCQALVMYEKVCREEKYVDEYEWLRIVDEDEEASQDEE